MNTTTHILEIFLLQDGKEESRNLIIAGRHFGGIRRDRSDLLTGLDESGEV